MDEEGLKRLVRDLGRENVRLKRAVSMMMQVLDDIEDDASSDLLNYLSVALQSRGLNQSLRDEIDSLSSSPLIPTFYEFSVWCKERQQEDEDCRQIFINGSPAVIRGNNDDAGGKWQAAIKRTLNVLRKMLNEDPIDELGKTEIPI